MAAPVYSTRFLALANASGTVETFTVPTGFVVVVADITVYQPATVDTSLLVQVVSPYLVLYYGGAGGAANSVVTRSCRVVLNAGEELQAARSTASSASVAVSGYLLTL